MSSAEHEIQFEPLLFKRRALLSVDPNQYSVRSSSGELREIKAETAYEAFLKSGLKDAIKIERLSSLSKDVIEKAKFVDEASAAQTEETLHDRILNSKNPVVSATELDELIRSLKKGEEKEDISALLPSMEMAAPASPPPLASPPIDSSPVDSKRDDSPSFVPQPSPEPLLEAAPAIGLDVHGDGFDEIIPTAPVKPVASKPHAEPTKALLQSSASGASADVTPERELSAEEVEKLLSGK